MQGSEQNMDSLPLRHRSIAICNPSPAPPMTASFVRCSSQTEETQVPRSWKRAAAHRQAIILPACVALSSSPPSSSLPFPPPSGVAPRIHHGANTRFDTLSYEPYVPLQVAVTQQ